MKLRQTAMALCAVAAVLVVTAACGSERTADPAPTPSATTSASPTTIASGEPVPGKLDIAPGRIGSVKVGMTKSEAAATGYFDTDVKVGADICTHIEPLQWKKSYQNQVDVVTDDAGSIISMGVRKGLKTDTGVGIGNTLDDVRDAYANLSPAIEAGYGQTGVFFSTSAGWIGFLFNEDIADVTPSSEVTFIEVTKDVRPDLIRDGC